VELVYKQAAGAPMARIDFTSWDLTPQIADETFDFQGGEAAQEVSLEQFTSRLLAGGDPAADAATSDSGAPGDTAAQ
jgi:hypothetical protein